MLAVQSKIITRKSTMSISLPKKIQSNSLNIICDTNTTPQYNLFLNSPTFDPNTEGSPPNTFMKNLHERMQQYHT